jgi:gliding motility-associated-like protein
LVINATNGDIDPAASTAGAYTVNYDIAASGGCAAFNTTTSVTITTAPTATIAYASPFCSTSGTQTVTLTGTTGGTFSSTAGLVINATTGDIDPAASTAGTYTVNYDIAASGGCAAFNTTTSITITTAPTATIAYASPFCSTSGTQTVTLTGTTGGTFSSTAGLVINGTNGAIDPAASTAGNYTVNYDIAASGGCAAFNTTTSITITTAPTATIAYASPFCSTSGTQTVTLTVTTGGTFSSTAGLVINATTGDIDPAASTAGTYTVNYDIAASGGCAAFNTTTSVTITTAPTATIAYASPFCSTSGTQVVTLTGTTGGTFSSTAGLNINSTSGDIDPAASTAGTYTVNYDIAASGGCVAFNTNTSVTITTAPTATIAYASPFCSTSGTQTVTLTGTTGGTFSSTAGLVINATTGDIDPAASTAGTYTVNYDFAASGGCAAFNATTSVTITTAPTATIAYASPFCSTSGTQTVTLTGTTGGSFSSTAGLVINATTGDIDPAASTAGTYTVNYDIAAAAGCPAFNTTTSVTITTAPTATISYASPFCSTSGTQTVTLTGTTGGTFSSTAGLVINATTGDINPAASAAGTYTVNYDIAAAAGCAAFNTTTSITITTAPTATIAYASPFCSTSGTQAVTLTGTTGGTFSSIAGLVINATTGDIDPAASTAGTYTVNYDIAAAAGCAAFNTTTSITITTAPTATIVYASPFCSTSGTQTVTLTGTTGGTFSSTAGLVVNATTGDIDPAASTAGTYTVNYDISASGGCAAFNTTTSVTITTAPTATIAYASPFCSTSGTQTVTLTGTTGGIFSSTAGLVINATTGDIDPAASTAGTYTVNYDIAASGGCSAFNTNTTVTLQTGGSTFTLFTSNACGSNSNGSIAFSSAAGLNYGYSAGPTFTGALSQVSTAFNLINNLSSGEYTVRLDYGGGCYNDQTIDVNSDTPPTPFVVTGTGSFCSGTTVVINLGGSESDVNYQLLQNGIPVLSPVAGTTEDIDFNINPGVGVQVYTIVATSTATGCQSPMSPAAIVTVNATPVIDSIETDCSGGVGNNIVTLYTAPTSGLEFSMDNGVTYQSSNVFSGLSNNLQQFIVRNTTTLCLVDTNYLISCNYVPEGIQDFTCSKINSTAVVNVLVNDSDAENDPLTTTLVATGNSIKGGTFSMNGSGLLIYTPPASFTGYDTLTYEVCDPFNCSFGLVVIKVSDDSAYANPDFVELNKNENFISSQSVLINDSTSDGDIFTISTVTNGVTKNGGTYSLDAVGNFTYTPPFDFSGKDEFTYIICDRCGRCDQAVVEILVNDIFIPEGFSPNEDGSHDYFIIEGAESYTVDIKVFNRWGSLVYEKDDYKAPEWWDGTSNRGLRIGDRLPDGTYYYVIDLNDGRAPFVRYITLKR